MWVVVVGNLVVCLGFVVGMTMTMSAMNTTTRV